jgi:hypothetical protein
VKWGDANNVPGWSGRSAHAVECGRCDGAKPRLDVGDGEQRAGTARSTSESEAGGGAPRRVVESGTGAPQSITGHVGARRR